MSRIHIREGGEHSPSTLASAPLAGAETAVIELARALARRGHEVTVTTGGTHVEEEENLCWGAVEPPDSADLFIANRFPRFLDERPRGANALLWLHNTGEYLVRPKAFATLLRHRPRLVFIGTYHRRQMPPLRVFRTAVIPYGLSDQFRRGTSPLIPPSPRAVFTSNPLRGLDWLLDRWTTAIRPQVPNAELHLFTGPATYGAWGRGVAPRMAPVLDRATNLRQEGIVLRDPLPKAELVEELARSRVMLYRGDPAETFCLAVAEAQALGVPCVVQPIGSLPERVVDGVTGFVAQTDADFEARAIQLLSDDDLWATQSRAAASRQGDRGWDDAAAEWERFL